MKTGEVAQWKQDTVKNLVAEIKENPVVGILNFQDLPSKQLLQIKHALRGDVIIKMARKRLIKLVLKEAKIEGLKDYLKGEPALLLTKENPFKIAKKLRDSRTNAPAKPGTVMPKDIIIPAGETTFAPGPIVGELGSMGVKAAIEKGKVVIKQDSVIAKEGEKIDKKKADLMARMGIEPIEIGLDITVAFENGLLYKSDVLGINTEQLVEDLANAASKCFKLTIGLGLPTKQNIVFLVQKGYREAKALAKEINYLCKATAGDVLSKAEAGMGELKKLVKEPVAGAPGAGAPKAETPVDEKSEEPKAEGEKVEGGEVEGSEKKDEVKEEAKPEEPVEKEKVEETQTESEQVKESDTPQTPHPTPEPVAKEEGLLEKIEDKIEDAVEEIEEKIEDVVEAVEEKLHLKKKEEKKEE